jgi:ribosomal protein L11 methyltransferase
MGAASGAGTSRGHARYELPMAGEGREALAGLLWAAGAVGVWERPDRLVAWFLHREASVPAGGTWSDEPDRDWQAEWKATIRPVRAGRIVVVPSWLASEHRPADDELTLVIDPGRAFGTGHHPTTVLCLEALDGLDLAGRTVADVGCGTGVLAIAAARRGAEAVAVDVDPEAVGVARANAARNDAAVEVHEGGVEVLTGPVDIVVANLVTDVIVGIADRLAAATRDLIIVSGIASERGPEVETALTAVGVEVRDVRTRDGWVAVTGRRRRG